MVVPTLVRRLGERTLRFRRQYSLKESRSALDTIDALKVVVNNRVGILSLNRGHVYNAINLEMVEAMDEVLHNWEYDPYITCIIISTSDENSFCSGGDVVSLYKEGVVEAKDKLVVDLENLKLRKEFFRREYQLHYKLKNMKTATLCFPRGICMGGGLGLMSHVKTMLFIPAKLAMPETQIGFFPDVGMAHYMSQFKYNLGMYYALTGTTIEPGDAFHQGLCQRLNSCVKNSKMAALENLAQDPHCTADDILGLFGRFRSDLHITGKELSSQVYLREQIMDAFGHEDVETIFFVVRKLAMNDSRNTEFWINTYRELMSASPLSLKVTHRHLRKATSMSLEEVLKMDYRLAVNFMKRRDFYEGIHSKLVLKGTRKPRWQHKFLDDVSDELVDSFFRPLEDEPDITLSAY